MLRISCPNPREITLVRVARTPMLPEKDRDPKSPPNEAWTDPPIVRSWAEPLLLSTGMTSRVPPFAANAARVAAGFGVALIPASDSR